MNQINSMFPIRGSIEKINTSSQNIIATIQKLKDDEESQYNQLIDITAIDNLQNSYLENSRYTIVYSLLSLTLNKRIFVFVNLNESDLQIDSITKIFESANWYEREVYDLFGIIFNGHPNLQRIMNDYNFKGHPLRKDFPLSGYEEVRYDESLKKVVYEDIKLSQDFRKFDTESPWEGMKKIIQDELKEKNHE